MQLEIPKITFLAILLCFSYSCGQHFVDPTKGIKPPTCLDNINESQRGSWESNRSNGSSTNSSTTIEKERSSGPQTHHD